MPERATLRADALHDARARLRAVEARLDGLGASCDARIGAFEARWAALPVAASFDPFAVPARDAEAEVAPTHAEAEVVRRRRARAPANPTPTTDRKPALPLPSDIVSATLLGPRLGAAVAQAMAGLIDAAPPGTARQVTARKSGSPRRQAKATTLAPALLSGAVGAALQSALGAVQPPAGRRTPPRAERDDPAAAAAVVAAALARVGASLRAVVQRPGAANAASRDLSLAGWTETQGTILTTALAAPTLLQRQLAALSAAPRRDPVRLAPSSSLRYGEAPPASIAPAAARAPSRLLQPSVSNTADTPPRTAARPDDRAPVADSIDALAELNRRLIDQAWLRGVDLS